MEVGGNKMEANKKRSLEAIQRRLDLRALVRDFDSMMPRTYMDSIVRFFTND
jgi:hypothetical protein